MEWWIITAIEKELTPKVRVTRQPPTKANVLAAVMRDPVLEDRASSS